MAIQYKQAYIHWNYFLAIESDFEKISRYIEFTESNMDTFSIELARIIMASVQEIDGIMKKLCSLVSPRGNSNNINDYKDIIMSTIPEFSNEEAHIPRFGMNSKPWENWNGSDMENPVWWKANNKIKHDRTQYFEKANLRNAFNSVGALLITTLHYYKHEIEHNNGNQTISWQDLTDKIKPESSLFSMKKDYYNEPGTWDVVEW